MITNYVLYHMACYDGFGSAYAAWVNFNEMGSPVKFIPVGYNQEFPLTDEELKNGNVYIVDFCYSREVTLRVSGLAKYLIILDHHASASESLSGVSHGVFDNNQSGAMLSWKFFNPGKTVPNLISYIQDRDLWMFKLPHSQEINAFIMGSDLSKGEDSFLSFQKIADLLENDFIHCVQIGEYLLENKRLLVDTIIDRSLKIINIQGHKVPCVNSSIFESEIGNELCHRFPSAPFSCVYFEKRAGREKWSLRSSNGFSVIPVAKKYGGGGHHAASGFEKDTKDEL